MQTIRPTAVASYIGKINENAENKNAWTEKRLLSHFAQCTTGELVNFLLHGKMTNDDSLDFVHFIDDAFEKYLFEPSYNSSPSFFESLALQEENVEMLVAAIELGRRLFDKGVESIKSADDFVPFVQHFALNSKEFFSCATLNSAYKLQNIRVISVGTVSKAIIHPREIFEGAIVDRAAAIILCHNHPSGVLEPSTEDISSTIRIQECGELMGIRVIDHIIVSQNGYFSFAQADLL